MEVLVIGITCTVELYEGSDWLTLCHSEKSKVCFDLMGAVMNTECCVPCRVFYIKKMKVTPRTAREGAVPRVVRGPKCSHPRRGRRFTRRSGREFALPHFSLSNLSRITYIL